MLYRAVERQIPDVRERAQVTLIGTPLTHERFLRRERGTYGAFVDAADGVQLPGAKTALAGFYCVGDSASPPWLPRASSLQTPSCRFGTTGRCST